MINRQCRTLLKESSAARRMLVFGTFSGVVYAMMNFGEVIARKSLGASALQITLMTMAMPVTSLTSVWWGRILIGRDQRAVLWVVGLFGLGMVFSGMFLDSFAHLFIMFMAYFISFALLGTAQNRIFQQHIPANQTGGLFGLSYGFRMGISALISAGAGWWMEIVDKGWQQLFPFAGLIGVFSIWAIAQIPTGMHREAAPLKISYWMTGPLKDVIVLLKRRKDYLRFEIAFMIYGIAFMMTLPVVPIFLVDELQLTYGEIGLSRGTAFQLVMIAGVPLFGRMFDRSTPHKLAGQSFFILAFFPLVLLSAKYFDGNIRFLLVIASFVIFGTALSAVAVLWNLSSMRFIGKDEDAGQFQSVHIAATGVRGLFAPMLGYLIMTRLGTSTALIASAATWLLSAIAMYAARKYDVYKGEAVSLRAD